MRRSVTASVHEVRPVEEDRDGERVLVYGEVEWRSWEQLTRSGEEPTGLVQVTVVMRVKAEDLHRYTEGMTTTWWWEDPE